MEGKGEFVLDESRFASTPMSSTDVFSFDARLFQNATGAVLFSSSLLLSWPLNVPTQVPVPADVLWTHADCGR